LVKSFDELYLKAATLMDEEGEIYNMKSLLEGDLFA
jgi:hypothetical protein